MRHSPKPDSNLKSGALLPSPLWWNSRTDRMAIFRPRFISNGEARNLARHQPIGAAGRRKILDALLEMANEMKP